VASNDGTSRVACATGCRRIGEVASQGGSERLRVVYGDDGACVGAFHDLGRARGRCADDWSTSAHRLEPNERKVVVAAAQRDDAGRYVPRAELVLDEPAGSLNLACELHEPVLVRRSVAQAGTSEEDDLEPRHVGYEESRGADENIRGFASLKPAGGRYTRWCGFRRRKRFPQVALD
jgi:hypothetical protein